MKNLHNSDLLLLIDGSNMIHRAWHAMPEMYSSYSKYSVGAVFGFSKMMIQIMDLFKPSKCLFIYDVTRNTWRNKIYKEYKANRNKDYDPDFAFQSQMCLNVIKSFNMKIESSNLYEADDLLATYAKNYTEDVIVVTSDKDLLQLIDPYVKIYDAKNKIIYNYTKTKEKIGVYPRQIPTLLALMGDQVDNIPNVPKVGLKTATELVTNYRSIYNIYENIDSIKGKLKQNLIDNKRLVLTNLILTTLVKDCDVIYNYEDLNQGSIWTPEFKKLMSKLEFNSILNPKSTEGTKNKIKKVLEAPSVHSWFK